jgi:hypothetical protein
VNRRRRRSRSLLPAISRHGHSWHRAPLGPMAIDLFNIKTFVFFLPLLLPIVRAGVGLFLRYRLVFTYHTLFHLKLCSFFPPGIKLNIYIFHPLLTKHNTIFCCNIHKDFCQCRTLQQSIPQLIYRQKLRLLKGLNRSAVCF